MAIASYTETQPNRTETETETHIAQGGESERGAGEGGGGTAQHTQHTAQHSKSKSKSKGSDEQRDHPGTTSTSSNHRATGPQETIHTSKNHPKPPMEIPSEVLACLQQEACAQNQHFRVDTFPGICALDGLYVFLRWRARNAQW